MFLQTSRLLLTTASTRGSGGRPATTMMMAMTSKRTMTSASSPAKFRILGLQQIAVGALAKSELSALWQGAFGLEKVGDFKSEKENVDEDILILGPKGPLQIEVDLMQPLDPEKSPKVHIPNLNHIGLWVDDLRVAVEELGKKGVRFTPGGIRKGASGYDVTFIHPKGDGGKSPIGGCGVLIELVQAPPDVIKALGGGVKKA